MNITGPAVWKQVIDVQLVVESRMVLDLDAYWNLGFDGEELDMSDPTLLYNRAAFPTLAAAQHQYRLERAAIEARHQGRPRRRPAVEEAH